MVSRPAESLVIARLLATVLVALVISACGDTSSTDTDSGGGGGDDSNSSSYCSDQADLYSQMHSDGKLSDEDYGSMMQEIEDVCE